MPPKEPHTTAQGAKAQDQGVADQHAPTRRIALGLRDSLDRRLSVAPMLDWTTRHWRYFARQLTRHTLLYTEMITTGALIHGDRARFLRHDPIENPLALQLGGSDPRDMAECARMAEEAGFDEVNINVGCPSDRVQSGRFGACLMAEPELVADCIAAMRAAVLIPVTVKSRIGIDDQDSYAELVRFTRALVNAGVDALILHARKAWLQGLSPKENREIPPLRYDWVRQLKADFPKLPMVINGGIQSLDAGAALLVPDATGPALDGIMIGRAAYETPWLLAEADARIFGAETIAESPQTVIEAMFPYVERQLAAGVPLSSITRHLLGLFHGRSGAKAWRRYLSDNAHKPDAGLQVLEAAIKKPARGGF